MWTPPQSDVQMGRTDFPTTSHISSRRPAPVFERQEFYFFPDDTNIVQNPASTAVTSAPCDANIYLNKCHWRSLRAIKVLCRTMAYILHVCVTYSE